MTTLRTAAQQALEAMRCAVPTGKITLADWYKSITALKAALAEHDKKIVWVEERKAHWAEQLQLARENQERERQQREEAALAEPVQEQPVCDECGKSKHDGWALYCVGCVEPMFAPPQRQAEPVQEPVQDGKCKHCVDGCPACDARKLPVQEPVAWMHVPHPGNGMSPMVSLSKHREPSMYAASVPLFFKEHL